MAISAYENTTIPSAKGYSFHNKVEGLSLGAGEFLAVGEPCVRQSVSVANTYLAGQPYPNDSANAVGIVYETVMANTDGDGEAATASIVIEGTVYADRVNISDEAKNAMKGIKFITRPTVDRSGDTTTDSDVSAN